MLAKSVQKDIAAWPFFTISDQIEMSSEAAIKKEPMLKYMLIIP